MPKSAPSLTINIEPKFIIWARERDGRNQEEFLKNFRIYPNGKKVPKARVLTSWKNTAKKPEFP